MNIYIYSRAVSILAQDCGDLRVDKTGPAHGGYLLSSFCALAAFFSPIRRRCVAVVELLAVFFACSVVQLIMPHRHSVASRRTRHDRAVALGFIARASSCRSSAGWSCTTEEKLFRSSCGELIGPSCLEVSQSPISHPDLVSIHERGVQVAD